MLTNHLIVWGIHRQYWPFFPDTSGQIMFPQLSLHALTPNEQMKRNAWFLSSFPVTYVFRRLSCILKTHLPEVRDKGSTWENSTNKNTITLPPRILLRTNQSASRILLLGKAVDPLCVNVGTNGSRKLSMAFRHFNFAWMRGQLVMSPSGKREAASCHLPQEPKM